jgi:hypothetical protein
MLMVAAEAFRSHGWMAGGIASLVYTIVIGGIFGWLVSAETPNEPRLMVWGGLYGLAWWILSGLIVVPALLGKVPLSSAGIDTMKPVALASLIEHVLYGVILGFVFALLTTYVDRRHATHAAHHAA